MPRRNGTVGGLAAAGRTGRDTCRPGPTLQRSRQVRGPPPGPRPSCHTLCNTAHCSAPQTSMIFLRHFQGAQRAGDRASVTFPGPSKPQRGLHRFRTEEGLKAVRAMHRMNQPRTKTSQTSKHLSICMLPFLPSTTYLPSFLPVYLLIVTNL